jgi:uncharacterized membrane protein YhaH (DUF805 family)
MSRGTVALVLALLALSLVLILAASLVIVAGRLRDVDSPGDLSFAEALWVTGVRTLDPGTFAGDTNWSFRWVTLGVTLGGIFIISALIGVLANGLENRMAELRRGRSRVIETGHTVILGWSPQVFTVVSELAHANRTLARKRRSAPPGQADQRSACVVILADRDKVEMEEEMSTKVPDTLGTRLVFRSGDQLDLDDLALVSPETSRAIIILSPGGRLPT